MIKVQIGNEPLKVRDGVSKTSGNPYQIRKQIAWAHMPGNQYPLQILIFISKDKAPYAPGEYKILPSSLVVNQYKQLQFKDQLELEPLPTTAKA